jgi:peroxiredoxin
MSIQRFGGVRTALIVLLLGVIAVPVLFVAARTRDRAPTAEAPLADFTLKDTAGRDVSLADFRDRKAVVVAFLGTECPLGNLYIGRLKELHDEFAPRGVQFLAVNSNSQDSAEEVAEHARKNEVPFSVLKDANGKVADLFGAERTPSVFLLDAGRVVRYRGRVDDQYGIGYKRTQPTRRDLAEALEEVLAGQAVSVPVTQAVGCFIGREKPAEPERRVTYTKDVAIILQKNCQECHRPGQIGPFSLLTYRQARGWSATIREVVSEGRMPPWNADPRHGRFANDRSLPKQDRDTLLAWIDQGCPEGDAADLPPAAEFRDDWTIGQPDLVLTMKEPYRVPAQAPASGIRYQYFALETNFDRDVWVQAAEARPGNRAVVHHIIAFIGEPPQREGQETVDIDMLAGYVPGNRPPMYPAGLGKRVPKGAKIVLQVHYTTNGTEQADQSSVGLVFAKEPPRHQVRARFVENRHFVLPPGAADHEVTAASTFEKDAVLLSLSPHMHLRGKSFEVRAVFPDGKSEVLLSVPRYDFMWQHTYVLAKPLDLPAGTRLECTARFDDSENNPNNPDPTKEVRWGDQSWEEMMIGVVGYAWKEEPGRE